MNIELTLKQEILTYVELKSKFQNISYQQFCDMCVEAEMGVSYIQLSILINKVFGIGLEHARTLAVAYLEGKNLNEYLSNINIK